MAISNLETIIDNIEQMIENVHADNRGRIMLPKDTLRQLLGELKDAVPVEIKRFNEKTRELENSKSRELEQARLNAERIMNEANELREKMLNENEQVKFAEEKANQILMEASNKANDMIVKSQMQAIQLQEKSMREYDESLAYLISYIQKTGNDVANLMNAQLQVLSNKLNEVVNSRNELQNEIAKRQMQNNNDMNGNTQFNRPSWG